MLVHPPRKSFFRRQFWNLERITRLAVRREAYLVRILIIDADAHDIEIHHRAQLACEKPEEFLRRADCDEGLRNAEESFVSLGCRLPGRALVYVAHPYRQLRFDSISHLSQRLGAQNNARQHSAVNKIHPGGRARHSSAKKQSTPTASAIRLGKTYRQSGKYKDEKRVSGTMHRVDA